MPRSRPLKRLSDGELAELRAQLVDLLDRGWIQHAAAGGRSQAGRVVAHLLPLPGPQRRHAAGGRAAVAHRRSARRHAGLALLRQARPCFKLSSAGFDGSQHVPAHLWLKKDLDHRCSHNFSARFVARFIPRYIPFAEHSASAASALPPRSDQPDSRPLPLEACGIQTAVALSLTPPRSPGCPDSESAAAARLRHWQSPGCERPSGNDVRRLQLRRRRVIQFFKGPVRVSFQEERGVKYLLELSWHLQSKSVFLDFFLQYITQITTKKKKKCPIKQKRTV